MNDSNFQQNWFNAIAGALFSVLAYFLLLYRSKIDRIDRSFISKEDFKDEMAKISLERRAMHDENLAAIRELASKIDVAQNAGFPRTGAGSPNGSVTSFYIGEQYFDTTNLKWWAASTFQSTVWTQLTN